MDIPPVVNYGRLKRVYGDTTPKKEGGFNFITSACIGIIFFGILFLIKRFKDKQSYSQHHTKDSP